jgi:hypothetical protein
MSRFRPHLNLATVISFIALFIALGGGAYAVKVKLKANAVKSKHIAPDAVTGEDVAEGTLGNVPSATNATTATNATNAQNARTIGGVPLSGLQEGDGLDDAQGATGIADAGTETFEIFAGDLTYTCDTGGADDVVFDDFDDPGSPTTDIWNPLTGYAEVPDGDELLVMSDNDLSRQLVFYSGNGEIEEVTIGVTDDGSTCTVVFIAQQNQE